MRRYALIAAAIAVPVLVGCAVGPQDAVVARQDFAAYCSGCHGTDARGQVVSIGGKDVKTPDLTMLAKNNGGTFPRQRVMAQIDGYTRDDHTMPEFGEVMLEGDKVLVDFGDGISTPTPVRLVALTDYLESLQR